VQRDAELVRDVLHRFLAGGECPRDDDDVVAASRLLLGQLEHVERSPTDVQPRDDVHDREAHDCSLTTARKAVVGEQATV
jgi:hypothetical protein